MPKKVLAFTAFATGLARDIVTPVQVKQSKALPQTPVDAAVFKGKALWDTGAQRTCISSRVVQQLGIEPISVANVRGVSGSCEANVYVVDLLLPNDVLVRQVRAIEPKGLEGADILIGMDIITTGDLSITNAGGKTVVSFRFPPADAHIDYVEEANLIEQKHERRDRANKLARRGKLRYSRPAP